MFFKKPVKKNPFHSFWMGGYECTDKLNVFGNRVDFLKITGHLDMIDEDYKNLSIFNIRTVREGIRWSQVEKIPYQYDWSSVEKIMRAGALHEIQQVWDICHFGFPDDLTPLHPMFARRFAALCKEFVQFYRSIDHHSEIIVTPINEVSFLSWLGGDACGTSPYCRGYGVEVKYALMKAYIEGIEALKAADSRVRIMPTEPLVNMVPPLEATPEEITAASVIHDAQFQVLDILSGKMYPELRGKPEYLDILGCNYYYNNQWIFTTFESLSWKNENNDPRFLPLSNLLIQLHERYNCPIVLSETSHPGEDRPRWVEFIASECNILLEKEVPLWGVCWYPVIDRPDWDYLSPWHKAGLWDVEPGENGVLNRVLDGRSAQAMLLAQASVGNLSVIQQ
ncbi:MAG: amine oxidase [Chitinophagaceae bacterium]|nr:amine oxidase [Chitinophagaceae bacterium]